MNVLEPSANGLALWLIFIVGISYLIRRYLVDRIDYSALITALLGGLFMMFVDFISVGYIPLLAPIGYIVSVFVGVIVSYVVLKTLNCFQEKKGPLEK